VQAIAGLDVALQVHRRGEGSQSLEHGGGGDAEIVQGLIKRRLDDDAGCNLAREGLEAEEARLLVSRTEKLLLGYACLAGRRIFGSQTGRNRIQAKRSGERRGKRGLLHGLPVCDEITASASVLLTRA
jgi:hypothetical protein